MTSAPPSAVPLPAGPARAWQAWQAVRRYQAVALLGQERADALRGDPRFVAWWTRVVAPVYDPPPDPRTDPDQRSPDLLEFLSEAGIIPDRAAAFARLCDRCRRGALDLGSWSPSPVAPRLPWLPFPLLVVGEALAVIGGQRTVTLATSEPGLDHWLRQPQPLARWLRDGLRRFYEADQLGFVYVPTEEMHRWLAGYGPENPLRLEPLPEEPAWSPPPSLPASAAAAWAPTPGSAAPAVDGPGWTEEGWLAARPFVAVENCRFSDSLLRFFGTELHARYRQLPLYGHPAAGLLTLAGPLPPTPEQKASILSMLRRLHGRSFSLQHVWADPVETERIIARQEADRVDVGALVSGVGQRLQASGQSLAAGIGSSRSEVIRLEDLLRKSSGDTDADAKAKDLLSEILLRGFEEGASDVHLSTQEDRFWVRYRLDGILSDHPYRFEAALAKLVIARVKVLARLDHAYSPLPQEGAFMSEHAGRRWEIRVSVANTEVGEQAVLRLHDPGRSLPTLEALGFRRHEADLVRGAVETDHGLLVICGPTGSGKSTTLYSVLTHLVDRQRWKVITGEQPVEIRIPLTEQIPVVPPLTFAKFNESALRQDPDYLLVGETRDPETALQVMRAANTGHNVFTTLHTNGAAEAPGRLADLGVAPYLLADCLYGVVAQRLVRLLCGRCKRAVPLRAEFLRVPGLDPAWLDLDRPAFEPQGCAHCRGRGFLGRLCVAEGIRVGEAVRGAVARRAPAAELRALQVAQGGQTLFEQACRLVGEGRISLGEALTLQRD